MLASTYFRRPVSRDDVVRQVEQFIQSQLGEDVVEFKKPKTHAQGYCWLYKSEEVS